MSMNRSGPASLIVALVLTACLVEPAAGQRQKKPVEIDVVANDYAFIPLPASISAGPTIFTFANNGKVFHEVNIARLKPGATVQEFAKADAPRRRELIERSVGILIGGPGNSPDGRILVNLLKGRTYIAYCQFKDTPDAPAHLTLGMYTSFIPK
jgi:plastocyanin